MHVQLNIDKGGRIVIPKPVREELGLEAGDSLELESNGERITLRPVRATVPLAKEKGIWVFQTSGMLRQSETAEMLREIREERDLANFGAHGFEK